MTREAKRERAEFDRELLTPVLIAQPVVHHAAATFFGLLTVSFLIFSVGPKFARQETVRGEVVASAGFTVVGASSDGDVLSISRRVGDHVAVGDLVATVRLPRAVTGGRDVARDNAANLANSINSVKRQMGELQDKLSNSAAHEPQISATLARSLQSLEDQKRLSQHGLELIASRRAKIATLEKSGFVSQSTLDELEGVELRAGQERRSLDQQTADLERAAAQQRLSYTEELRSTRLSLAELDQRRLELSGQMQAAKASDVVEVRAAHAGRVVAITVRPGQRVTAGEELLAISQPTAAVSIKLDVPSSAVARLRSGQSVNLKYDAFPFATYGIHKGVVTSVDEASVQAGTIAQGAGTARVERSFGVMVAPEQAFIATGDQRVPLRIGMQVTADVTVDRRTLLGWWLEPLEAVQGRAA